MRYQTVHAGDYLAFVGCSGARFTAVRFAKHDFTQDALLASKCEGE